MARRNVFLAAPFVRRTRIAPPVMYVDSQGREGPTGWSIGCADGSDDDTVSFLELAANETADGQYGIVEMR
jgi:hypothetical protein